MEATKPAYACPQLRGVEEADVSVYEVGLRLEGKAVLVVGGGTVAARRIPRLLDAGAHLTLVSPEATTTLGDYAASGALRWERRPWASGDTAGAHTADAAIRAAWPLGKLYPSAPGPANPGPARLGRGRRTAALTASTAAATTAIVTSQPSRARRRAPWRRRSHAQPTSSSGNQTALSPRWANTRAVRSE